jgi:hypothetical protein
MTLIQDRGAGGAVITPGAGQIEGASTFALAQNQPIMVFSDGSNYHVWGFVTGATSITINGVTCTLGGSCTITAGPTTCSNTNNYACLNLDETWAARQRVPCTTLTDGATIAVDASLKNAFCVTITGNSHVLSNPTNLQSGTYLFVIYQNSHTGFGVGTNYKFPGGTAPSWSSGKDVISCYVDFATSSDLLCTAGTNES